LHFEPYADCRTVQALESSHEQRLPSFRCHPGRIADGIGSGSINGFRMNGLVGKFSITGRPVSISIGYGCGGNALHATIAPEARLAPTKVALADIKLS
jgi:hypothetical protein